MRSRARIACAITLIALFGALAGGRLAQLQQVRADSNRVFELRVYHALPGKLPALESRFRDTTSKILARHNLNVVGYWVTADAAAPDQTFIFMVAHRDREEAKKNWGAVWADPEFQTAVVGSEKAEPTVSKVDTTYLDPTDFSPLK